MSSLKDIYGKPLKVGQKVAAAIQPTGSRYDLVRGEIISLSKCMARIRYVGDFGREAEKHVSPYKLAVVE